MREEDKREVDVDWKKENEVDKKNVEVEKENAEVDEKETEGVSFWTARFLQ